MNGRKRGRFYRGSWHQARCRKWTYTLFRNRGRGGFTLLEIILALAILAGSLAALGEVMRMADQNASLTRDETARRSSQPRSWTS